MTMPPTVLRFQLAKRATKRPGPDEIADANLRATSWASKRMEAAGPWDRAGKTCSRRRQRKTAAVAGLEAPQQSPALRVLPPKHWSPLKHKDQRHRSEQPGASSVPRGCTSTRDDFIATITPVHEEVPNSCSSLQFQQANELLKGKDIPLNSALGQACTGLHWCNLIYDYEC